ncbi:MAG: ribonuclease P protein component [Phycisphaerales bacterium]|nr:ribonuclease P protein component [Phycisphaerales bacterium]
MDTPTQQFKFRRAQRIRSSTDFDRIFNRRCAAHSSAMGVYVDGNEFGHPRLGMRIGKRAGKAVFRVRSRRRMREAFRKLQHELAPMDYVVIIRSIELTSAECESMLRNLADRAIRKLERSR